MALFRGENPVLGNSSVVEFPNGMGAPTQARIPMIVPISFVASATSTSTAVFTSPANPGAGPNYGQYALAGVSVRFGTGSTSGTLQVEKTPSGTAAGSGTNLLTGTVALSGTTNTNASGTLSFAPGINSNLLAAGDSLSLVFAGTMTSLANCAITLYVQRVV